jgi:hypothetical protein
MGKHHFQEHSITESEQLMALIHYLFYMVTIEKLLKNDFTNL